MKESNGHQRFSIVLMVCFCLLIVLLSLQNAGLVTGPAGRFLNGEIPFAQMTKDTASGLVSDNLWEKDRFIELNGLYARVSGRRVYNGTVLLRNGMLAADDGLLQVDTENAARKIGAFSALLGEMEIPFLYIASPFKMDPEKKLLPEGVKNNLNEIGSALMTGLAANGVHCLDLQPALAATPELIGRYYYRTDHHWNPGGALEAFGIILRELQAQDPALDVSLAEAGRWERHEQPDWFLGSLGRRVGPLYAGTDDLIWYTPRFETEMSCLIPHNKTAFRGDYEEAVIRKEFLEKKDYFHSNPYCINIGGDYPLVRHRNAQAPNRQKVLLIKDSFMLPMQCFFATAFREVDVIDARHFRTCSIAEYCVRERPDLVIMMSLPTLAVQTPYTELGVEAAEPLVGKEWVTLLEHWDAELPATGSQFNFARIPVALENGVRYRVSVEDLERLAGSSPAASVLLFNSDNNNIVAHDLFDIDYLHENGGASRYFTVPEAEGNYSLLIYTGINEKTAGCGLKCTGISVAALQ